MHGAFKVKQHAYDKCWAWTESNVRRPSPTYTLKLNSTFFSLQLVMSPVLRLTTKDLSPPLRLAVL